MAEVESGNVDKFGDWTNYLISVVLKTGLESLDKGTFSLVKAILSKSNIKMATVNTLLHYFLVFHAILKIKFMSLNGHFWLGIWILKWELYSQ